MLPQFRLSYFSHHGTPIMPALHLAAYFGLKETVKALVERGHEINERADSGRTAISVASMVGQKDTVRLLLRRDADPCIATDAYNITPLHCAACANKPSLSNCSSIRIQGRISWTNAISSQEPLYTMRLPADIMMW
jgi:Ankyrin repeats (3 copies)